MSNVLTAPAPATHAAHAAPAAPAATEKRWPAIRPARHMAGVAVLGWRIAGPNCWTSPVQQLGLRLLAVALVYERDAVVLSGTTGAADPDGRVRFGNAGYTRRFSYDLAWRPREGAKYRAIDPAKRGDILSMAYAMDALARARVDGGYAVPDVPALPRPVAAPAGPALDFSNLLGLENPVPLVAARRGLTVEAIAGLRDDLFNEVVSEIKKMAGRPLADEEVADLLASATDGPPPQVFYLGKRRIVEAAGLIVDMRSAAEQFWRGSGA